MKLPHFLNFKTDISGIELPEKFTFPFYYEPHQLAIIASKEIQEYLLHQTDFTHNFGLDNSNSDVAIGKMFGVLVVKNENNELGYLAAFSGKLDDNSLPKKFVPPVFNIRAKDGFFLKGEAEIDVINDTLSQLQKDETYQKLKKSFKEISSEIDEDLRIQRRKIKLSKAKRKEIKKEAITSLSNDEYQKLTQKLQQESYNQQFFYKELQEYYQTKIEKVQQQLIVFEDKITQLKKERKEKSNQLQERLFNSFHFLNQYKESKGLLEIFTSPKMKPPAGSGECAAPKLLQYAFANDLQPITMAEFWWGVSPNSAVRKHKNYYPACQGRCKPILSHMLKDIEMDENVLLNYFWETEALKVIYEDDAIVVVNKPAEFLSVPGKVLKDSVYSRIKAKYPEATGPIIVHRLDMSTSGILVLTKTKEANTLLQHQFIKRTVKKRYVALLDGIVTETKGTIELPLRVDLADRPKQLVDYEFGKHAKTNWKRVAIEGDKTRVHFYPITGRTHQLRVHAAHKNGLNTPIFGDDLYGKKENRLHLHATYIEFVHPTTQEKMHFNVAPDF